MLQSIAIKNLAIVSELNLDFSPGMTALTGETGAGKSILIDALGLALGDKTDKGMIRAGADKAEITAIFDISAISEAQRWLEEQDLLDDNDCHLRRVITADGKSKAFINGSPATLKSMQALAASLVEIHGQHAHQRLLNRAFQLQSLDAYAGHHQLLAQTSASFLDWQLALQQFNELKALEQDRVSRLELLKFQTDELTELALKKGETAELEERLKALSNADELIRGCYALSSSLYDDEQAVHSQLSSLQGKLLRLTDMDKALQSPAEMLDSALINIQEAADSLRHLADNLETDEQSLNQVETRIQSIHEMARKYRLEPEALCEKAEQVKQELLELETADQKLETLENQCLQLQQDFLQAAEKLRTSRKKAAGKLVKSTVELLKSLSMPQVRFDIDFEQLDPDKANKNGLDRIEFMVSANPGQPLAPLTKVASGGELSRISLAIQVATMSNLDVPTLIFDEVDVGIGGGTAEIVGRLMRQLGEKQQALCVTHLPQVASQAHHHFKVAKLQSSQSTVTTITPLSDDQRTDEIARMLGGVEVTQQTLAHAREMISKAG